MKKVISTLAVVLLIIVLSSVAAYAVTETSSKEAKLKETQGFVLGKLESGFDANSDKKVNIVDSCLIKRELIKTEIETPEQTTTEEITTEEEEIESTEPDTLPPKETLPPPETTTTEETTTIAETTTVEETTTQEETIENDGLDRTQFICGGKLFNWVQVEPFEDEDLEGTVRLDSITIELLGEYDPLIHGDVVDPTNKTFQTEAETFIWNEKEYSYNLNPYMIRERHFAIIMAIIRGEFKYDDLQIARYDFNRNCAIDEEDLSIYIKYARSSPQEFLYNKAFSRCSVLYCALNQLEMQFRKNKKIVVSNQETESRGTQYVTLDTTQEQYQSIDYYAYEVIENVNQDSIIIIFDGGEQMIVPKDDVEYWLTW